LIMLSLPTAQKEYNPGGLTLHKEQCLKYPNIETFFLVFVKTVNLYQGGHLLTTN